MPRLRNILIIVSGAGALLALYWIVVPLFAIIFLFVGSFLGIVRDDPPPGSLIVTTERINDNSSIWTYSTEDGPPVRRVLFTNGIPMGEQLYNADKCEWGQKWEPINTRR
jgi:hypothetical protein